MAVTFPAPWGPFGVRCWFIWIGAGDGHDADISRELTLVVFGCVSPLNASSTDEGTDTDGALLRVTW